MAEITDIKKHGTPEDDPEQSIEGSKSALKAAMCYGFDFMAGCQNIQEDIGCVVWEERMRSLLSSLSLAEEAREIIAEPALTTTENTFCSALGEAAALLSTAAKREGSYFSNPYISTLVKTTINKSVYSDKVESIFWELGRFIPVEKKLNALIDEKLAVEKANLEEAQIRSTKKVIEQLRELQERVAEAQSLCDAQPEDVKQFCETAKRCRDSLISATSQQLCYLYILHYVQSFIPLIDFLIAARLVESREQGDMFDHLGIDRPKDVSETIAALDQDAIPAWIDELCALVPAFEEDIRWCFARLSDAELAYLAQTHQDKTIIVASLQDPEAGPSSPLAQEAWERMRAKADFIAENANGIQQTLSGDKPPEKQVFLDNEKTETWESFPSDLKTDLAIGIYQDARTACVLSAMAAECKILAQLINGETSVKSLKEPMRIFLPSPRIDEGDPEEKDTSTTTDIVPVAQVHDLASPLPEDISEQPFSVKLSGSFKILRGEMRKGSERRAQQKQLKSERARLKRDESSYWDNLYILDHYSEIVADQEAIIARSSVELERLRPQLAIAEAAALAASAAAMKKKEEEDAEDDEEKRSSSGLGEVATSAASVAAWAAVTKLSNDIDAEEKALEGARNRIDHCNWVVSHPEETPLLKQKIEQEKVTIAEHERELAATEEHLAMLGEGSKLAKRFLAICLGTLVVIAIAIALIVSNLPGQATPTSHSSTASQTSPKASSSSERSSAETSEDSTDAEDALEAVARRDKVPIPSSHTIETRYYTVKVPDATDEWTYDYVNAYSTSSWDGKGGLGYITYIYRNDALIYEIACFGGVATPGNSDASVLVGTLDVPGTGELSVFAVVPIDREGPNADVAVSNAVDEANYYAENVNLNPDYTATAAEPESTGTSDGDGYVLPASDSEYYTRDQLEDLSDWELYLARNEVFARYGRQFKNNDLADYFSSQPWYNGEYSPEDFDGWFSPNEYEKANTDLILEIEHERNSPYLS